MPHSEREYVYISVLNCVLWDMEQMYFGICEIGLLVIYAII